MAIGAGVAAGISAFASIAAVGVTLVGIRQQNKAAQKQFQFEEATLRNKNVVAKQDIKSEKDNQQLRLRLISEAGRRRRGEIRVSQAALGQLVDVGSAADTTADLAAEVAFKKLLSNRESKNRIRNILISVENTKAQIGASSAAAKASSQAASITSLGTILTTGSSLTRDFMVSDGKLAFRTT